MSTLARVISTISLLLLSSYSFSDPSFAAAEHLTIGDAISLQFHPDQAAKAAIPLHLPNLLTATYGEIVSFGDFYGVVDEPISLGNTEEERKARFLKAYASFAIQTDLLDEAHQLITAIHDEEKLILDGMEKGEKPEDIYKKIGSEPGRRANCITGGGCDASTWWLSPGRYLKLAETNYDHFGDNALLAYQAGHAVALQEAKMAGLANDTVRLENAYAMNAFACHFLTDRFSAGHIRTPRVELPQHVTPAVVGALLAGIMHNEENPSGLHVYNLRGDHWLAFGDRTYFEARSETHRNLLKKALQYSADELFAAYQNKAVNYHVEEFIPYPSETANNSELDNSPLFYWDETEQKLWRRQDTANAKDKHWTTNWWGWSTLIELGGEQALPTIMQATLIRAGLGQKALAEGLITDPALKHYLATH